MNTLIGNNMFYCTQLYQMIIVLESIYFLTEIKVSYDKNIAQEGINKRVLR